MIANKTTQMKRIFFISILCLSIFSCTEENPDIIASSFFGEEATPLDTPRVSIDNITVDFPELNVRYSLERNNDWTLSSHGLYSGTVGLTNVQEFESSSSSSTFSWGRGFQGLEYDTEYWFVAFMKITDPLGFSSELLSDTSYVSTGSNPFKLNNHYDFSGNSNDIVGTEDLENIGAELTIGKNDQSNTAFLFHGDDNNHLIAQNIEDHNFESVSISTWIYVEEGIDEWNTILRKYHAVSNQFRGYYLGIHNEEKLLRWRVNNNIVDFNYPSDCWFHLTLTYSPSESMQVYINSEVVGMESTGSLIPTSTSKLVVGLDDFGDFGSRFKGSIDDIKFYNYTLNQDEISSIFRNESEGVNIQKDFSYITQSHWEGTYACSQGQTGVTITFDSYDATTSALTAIFEFYPLNIPATENNSGSYSLVGEFSGDRNFFELEPNQWIQQPPNFSMVGIEGYINGNDLNGIIADPNCGEISCEQQ